MNNSNTCLHKTRIQPMMQPETAPPTTLPEDDLTTPEGDNERLPDEPLTTALPTPIRPRGDQPHTTEPLYPAS